MYIILSDNNNVLINKKNTLFNKSHVADKRNSLCNDLYRACMQEELCVYINNQFTPA